jgi:hypothetical protein
MAEKILISLNQLKRMKLNTKELKLVEILCAYFIVNEMSVAERSKTKLVNLKPVEDLEKKIKYLLGNKET